MFWDFGIASVRASVLMQLPVQSFETIGWRHQFVLSI